MTKTEMTQITFSEILYDKKDWVAHITINRPTAYNAYSTECLEELATAFRRHRYIP